jgi:hypothetical protein
MKQPLLYTYRVTLSVPGIGVGPVTIRARNASEARSEAVRRFGGRAQAAERSPVIPRG